MHIAIRMIIRAIVFSIFSCALISASQLKPLPPIPVRRAEKLSEPERSLRLTMSKSMHDSQISEWDEIVDHTLGWKHHMVSALALALEEYHIMELSYPSNVSQLFESGYLDSRFKEANVILVDFCADRIESEISDNVLIYIPQPVGLTSIVKEPGGTCGDKIRSYGEYCVAVPLQFTADWTGSSETASVKWLKPFQKYEIGAIIYINSINPGASSCASCS